MVLTDQGKKTAMFQEIFFPRDYLNVVTYQFSILHFNCKDCLSALYVQNQSYLLSYSFEPLEKTVVVLYPKD